MPFFSPFPVVTLSASSTGAVVVSQLHIELGLFFTHWRKVVE